MNSRKIPSARWLALALLTAAGAAQATSQALPAQPTAPTVTVTRSPDPFVAGQPYTLSWTTANASKVSYKCTGGDNGNSGNLALSGSSTATAKANWVGNPSNCTWTLKGTDGSTATYDEAPRVTVAASTAPTDTTPTVTVTRSPDPFVAGQPYTLSWTTANASKVSYKCTGGDNGNSGNLALSGSSTATAKANWVGNPSNCTWTLKGTDGSTVTYDEAPRVTVAATAQPPAPPEPPAPAIPAASYNVDISYVPAGQGGAGQVASIGYPSGKVLAYQYDATGQLTGLTWNGQGLIANITWTPLGQPKGWTWAFVQGSPSASRSYDTAGNLTGNGIADYSYDGAGQVSQIVQHLYGPATTANGPAQPIDITTAIGYDATGRVTSVTHNPTNSNLPAGIVLQDIIGPLSATYSYDANGNRSQASYGQYGGSDGAESLTRNFTLNPAHNRIEAVQDNITQSDGSLLQETYALHWDASGHLTSDGKLDFEYDPRGRISKITSSNGSTSYQTNALGQRVRNTAADYAPRPAYRPLTKFEQRGLRLGHGVWDLVFERVG